MICLIALAVFGILGIFSATHRALAMEAFDCVFKRVTLRKCNTGFDRKMKMKITTGLLRKNQSVGKFVFKNFELLSWILTILTIASLIYSAISVYNFVAYGDCNPQNPGNCVYKDIQTGIQAVITSDKNLPENLTHISGKCPAT